MSNAMIVVWVLAVANWWPSAGLALRTCPDCGSLKVPYPLSTSSSCGDPRYKLTCNTDEEKLYLEALSGSYPVISIHTELQRLVISPPPLVSGQCKSRDFPTQGLLLNQSLPFNITNTNTIFLFNCSQLLLRSPLNCSSSSLCSQYLTLLSGERRRRRSCGMRRFAMLHLQSRDLHLQHKSEGGGVQCLHEKWPKKGKRCSPPALEARQRASRLPSRCAVQHWALSRIASSALAVLGNRGLLDDGTEVAVKVAKVGNIKSTEQLLNEVMNHRSLVRLLGCCVETPQPLLVYEYIFGVVLFELATSKKAIDLSRGQDDVNLAVLVAERAESGCLMELADRRLFFDVVAGQQTSFRHIDSADLGASVEAVLCLGLKCTHESLRPSTF
ncbi:hypothetical protein L7F22_023974 [Adiantum nelumboides]|nr:hypothetical protein [Adiantum nelumboides]